MTEIISCDVSLVAMFKLLIYWNTLDKYWPCTWSGPLVFDHRPLEAEAEHGEEGGDGDGEEDAGVGRTNGTTGLEFCFGLRAFPSLNSFSFFHPVDVGSGFRCVLGTLSEEKKRYYLGIFPKRRTPPLLGTPYPKFFLVFILHFRTLGTFLVFSKKLKICQYF